MRREVETLHKQVQNSGWQEWEGNERLRDTAATAIPTRQSLERPRNRFTLSFLREAIICWYEYLSDLSATISLYYC